MAGVATETGAAAVVMVAGGALEVVAGCGWWSRHAWTGEDARRDVSAQTGEDARSGVDARFRGRFSDISGSL